MTTQYNKLLVRISLAGCLALQLCGCSDTDGVVQLAPVSGTITRSGQPVANAIVEFFPTAGRASVGRTAADGSYTLRYSDDLGAVVGACRVQITPGTETSSAEGEDVVAAPMKAPAMIVKVPGTVEILDSDNSFDFDLSEFES